MKIEDDKLNDFFNHYFNQYYSPQTVSSLSESEFFLNWGVELKNYKSPTMNYLKPIKDYGFVKKYEIICLAFPYVSNLRPEQIETSLFLSSVEQIYRVYTGFAQRGLWKCKQQQNHLQQFVILYLHDLYTTETKLKKKFSQFDKFLLNFFYTLNILKTCNKYIKCFANFLSSSYSFGQLFLYLCLRNLAVVSNNEEMVSSSILKKVIRVFQSDDSHNISVCLSKDSIDQGDDKLVGINSIFTQPVGGCLSFPKVKMFKIMKICKMVEASSKETVEWKQFLKKYFQLVEEGDQICFEHIVSAAVAKNTYQLSLNLLKDESSQKQEQFLEQAFSYVFQVLQAVFAEQQPQIEDQKSLTNILTLRKHFQYMKKLNQHHITITNKFSKRILKNSYVLELCKKYL